MNSFKEYLVRGDYTYGGDKGVFYGETRLYGDGRFVGIMNDTGSDIINPKERKIVIGIKRDSDLAFFKLQPNTLCMPLIYSVRENSPLDFRGKWIPEKEINNEDLTMGITEGLIRPSIPQIREALITPTNSQCLEILSQVDRANIESWLPENLTTSIRVAGYYTGNLRLEEIRAVTA